MKITALEIQKNDPNRINLHIDGEFRLGLASEIAWSAHLHVGDEIGAEQLTDLERRDAAWKAREAALALLSFRPRTRIELQRRLKEKGYAPDVAEETVDALVAMGLVDDSSFAEMFVRDRVRLRPKGARQLTQELRAKGVDAETAQAAIGEVMEREDASETDLARRAAARWHPRAGEEPLRARRRLHGFLARRGFGGESIRTVMDEVLSRSADDDGDDFEE